MDPLPLLKDLVAVNSVNPGLVAGAPGEQAAADVCARALAAAGLEVTRQAVWPDRPNVVGVLDGRAPGPTVMLCGHLDTVGVEGMDAPFDPRVVDGRLYGRGAQDMKSGVAAMVAAAADLASKWTRGRLLVAAVVDEEHESRGAEMLVRDWRADAAIITEPTGLMLATAHKGFSWIEIVTHGRAAHGSRPDEGRDAIMRMGRVLSALAEHDREIQSRPAAGPEGAGSLHASTILGGRELSSYPDACTLQMECRTVWGDTAESVSRAINDRLTRLAADDAEFAWDLRVLTHRLAYRLDNGHPLVSAGCAALAQAGCPGRPVAMSYWTDAAILGAAGTPTVLFGPRGAGLHSQTEYVEIETVYTCRDVLVDLVRRLADG